MRLLFISPKIPYPPIDGHRKSIYGVIKHLSLRGHQIDLVAYAQSEKIQDYKEIQKYCTLNILNISTPNSIKGMLINLFSPRPYNLWKYEKSELIEFIQEYFLTNKPDIVQITNSHMGWIVDTIRKYSDSPVVLREENLELMIMKRFYQSQKNPIIRFYSYLQYKKLLKYEPELCSKMNLNIMISKNDEAELLKLKSGVNSVTIPLGVDDHLFNLTKNKTEPCTLFHIGSLDWYPNLNGVNWFVDNVFGKVLEKFPQTKLYLYGGGNYESITRLNEFNKNIVLKGFVKDIWQEINDKQLSIVPLRIGGGIRVKILELCAAGSAVISTSIGVEGIPLRDEKEILVADDSTEFAQKIVNVFNGNYSLEAVTHNARKVIRENYDWNIIAERFEDEYIKLLGNR
jgi:glycosyltransferase involved in cell wall biosynthesis